jgi:hypothetical protein
MMLVMQIDKRCSFYFPGSPAITCGYNFYRFTAFGGLWFIESERRTGKDHPAHLPATSPTTAPLSAVKVTVI